ncbi:Site-specific recombinase XerD [Nitrosomonas oligotropha]|uniref:Site-specific recombinase XerD n=1 Tax=Nitrosomonas oligotropha TaxID=42354 RepID=A0A1H8N7J7_9PROT|nr:Site-specific recombinase XerD [Nitrosomonas oligotropha]SEO25522.1 Site-specific recombinase XerD [Nitrosomonas oligotropha]
MSLFKRGKTWWISFTTPSGERVRCSAATEDKTQAQEFHDKLKAESWRVVKLGDKPKRTWDEAAYKWLMETQDKKTHHDDVAKINWLQQFFRGKYLDELTRDVIAGIGELKRKETSPATANRLLALIRSILRRAALDWEWIDKPPVIKLYREAKRRVRYLSATQASILIQELPQHLGDMVTFSLATGLRRSNVTKLEWSQVDMQRNVAWIHGDQAKAGKPIHVTLNATAIAVLTRQIGKHPRSVFSYKGKPITQVNTKAWYKALKRAGIEDFRWHDLRHTWASWLTQNGVPLNVIQEMGAWESAEMVRRYAHLAPEQFAQHARVLDGVLNVTNLAQSK